MNIGNFVDIVDFVKGEVPEQVYYDGLLYNFIVFSITLSLVIWRCSQQFLLECLTTIFLNYQYYVSNLISYSNFNYLHFVKMIS
jgi:hypothetical protein